jgi:type II secretory pathway predicted ATPase ExeA
MLPIYCKHFNLKREPFNITPDPGFLYLSDSHKEALAQLAYGVKGRRGFVVLTGEVGTGKTTLIQCLLRELNGNTKAAMVFNMVVDAKDLLRYICEKFGLLSATDAPREIHDYLAALDQFLLDCYRNGQNAALIIDEAQNLSTEVLENVRLLSNFETPTDKLLQIFLVGQPELGTRLNDPELRQLKQRIALRHHLRPLNLTECREYICRRLEVSEGSPTLFTSEAVEAIHEYAGGIPRIINILCDNGLLTAYALHKPTVESGMILEVARDLQLAISPGLVRKPIDPRGGSGTGFDHGTGHSPLISLAPKRTAHYAGHGEPQKSAQPDNKGLEARRSGYGAPQKVLGSDESERSKASRLYSGNASSQCIDYMIRVLTDAMGPIASVIVYEEVRAMGESVEQFPKSRLAELIDEATREIINESAKAHCKRLMLEGIRKISGGNQLPKS